MMQEWISRPQDFSNVHNIKPSLMCGLITVLLQLIAHQLLLLYFVNMNEKKHHAHKEGIYEVEHGSFIPLAVLLV